MNLKNLPLQVYTMHFACQMRVSPGGVSPQTLSMSRAMSMSYKAYIANILDIIFGIQALLSFFRVKNVQTKISEILDLSYCKYIGQYINIRPKYIVYYDCKYIQWELYMLSLFRA